MSVGHKGGSVYELRTINTSGFDVITGIELWILTKYNNWRAVFFAAFDQGLDTRNNSIDYSQIVSCFDLNGIGCLCCKNEAKPSQKSARHGGDLPQSPGANGNTQAKNHDVGIGC